MGSHQKKSKSAREAMAKAVAETRAAIDELNRPQPALEGAEAVLTAIEQRDEQLAYPVFVGNRQMFVERLAGFLPQLGDKIANFLQADVQHLVLPNGTVFRGVRADADITDGQLSLIKLLLNKTVPATTDLDSAGKDQNKDKAPKKVAVTINQIGGQLDRQTLSKATVNGVTGAQAVEVTKVRIKRPTVIDATADEGASK